MVARSGARRQPDVLGFFLKLARSIGKNVALVIEGLAQEIWLQLVYSFIAGIPMGHVGDSKDNERDNLHDFPQPADARLTSAVTRKGSIDLGRMTVG